MLKKQEKITSWTLKQSIVGFQYTVSFRLCRSNYHRPRGRMPVEINFDPFDRFSMLIRGPEQRRKRWKTKKALVCGAGGFIGGHLVKKLKREGYWVRGVDIRENEFALTEADEFLLLDLREERNCIKALDLDTDCFDEVYQLAADMGGMGFISSAECEIMHNSALINIHMSYAAAKRNVPKYFFIGLYVSGYETRRTRDDRRASLSRRAGQQVWMGKTIFRTNANGVWSE